MAVYLSASLGGLSHFTARIFWLSPEQTQLNDQTVPLILYAGILASVLIKLAGVILAQWLPRHWLFKAKPATAE